MLEVVDAAPEMSYSNYLNYSEAVPPPIEEVGEPLPPLPPDPPQCPQFGSADDPQLGGIAAGSVNDAVVAACLRWTNGEALWESVEQALYSMQLGTSDSSCGGSIVIFDWDDTLFPTASLSSGGYLMSPNDSVVAELVPCALAAVEALRTAKRYGKVVIVTNAICGWVHEMMARFVPLLEQEVADIPVISARSIYEPQGVLDPSQWKLLCFQRVVQCLFSIMGPGGIHNLVSIGDSWYERIAVFQAAEDLGLPCYVKSLKFLATPAVEDLARQLSICAYHFEWLMCHEGLLDLWLHPCGNVQVVTEAVLNGQIDMSGSTGSSA